MQPTGTQCAPNKFGLTGALKTNITGSRKLIDTKRLFRIELKEEQGEFFAV